MYFLGPLDFAKIYNINPLYTAGTNGSGRTIAVLGVTDIVTADVTLFDEVFGLTDNLNVIHNGADPGDLEDGNREEATLDVEWSGAIGQGAKIDFVVSKSTTTFGTDLSAIYVNDNNLADVMSVSYGGCELGFTLSEAEAESAIGEQATAQGITYIVASGDRGAEDCAVSSTSPADGAADFAVDLPGHRLSWSPSAAPILTKASTIASIGARARRPTKPHSLIYPRTCGTTAARQAWAYAVQGRPCSPPAAEEQVSSSANHPGKQRFPELRQTRLAMCPIFHSVHLRIMTRTFSV